MGEYAMVRGKGDKVVGIWVRDADLAKNRMGLQMLAIKHQLGNEIGIKLGNGNYRIVPNSYDSNGGYFLMLGNDLAPGESKPWWKFW